MEQRNDMARCIGKKAPAQLTAWIKNGRDACADSATDVHYPFSQPAPSMPAGNSRLVVLRKVPAVV